MVRGSGAGPRFEERGTARVPVGTRARVARSRRTSPVAVELPYFPEPLVVVIWGVVTHPPKIIQKSC